MRDLVPAALLVRAMDVIVTARAGTPTRGGLIEQLEDAAAKIAIIEAYGWN